MDSLMLYPSPPFHFAHTAYSHGWVVLRPNAWETDTETVRRVEQLSSGAIVALTITGNKEIHRPEIRVTVAGAPLRPAEKTEIAAAVARMFRVREDLSEFYALCRQRGGQWQNITGGLGRLLRSPRVFEDVVKCICTTNIQWGGTKRMVGELVEAFGAPFPGDSTQKAFPTPFAIAAVSPEEFARRVRLGYRAAYVHELARRVASGEMDLESLCDPGLPGGEAKKQLLAIKGIGHYAAATLLMLLGHYDELAIDTVFREFVTRKYFGGTYPGDDAARAIYEAWGRWKFLAYWFDLWQGPDEQL